MEPLNQDQLFRELTDIKTRLDDGFKGIHTRQDIANGRTSKLENKVTIMWLLWSAVGALLLAGVNRVLNFF